MHQVDNEKSDALFLKEEGNFAYKNGDWYTAISKYTEGLNLCTKPQDKVTILKNRAAVYLKTGEYSEVINDCTEALEISPNEPKALFRRAQAYDAQENFEKAYADVRKAQSVDPKNKEIQGLLVKLHQIVQDKVEENARTSNKVKQMFDLLFDNSTENEKRETAASNLVVLAKEKAGSEALIKEGILGHLVQMLKGEKNKDIRISCTRILSEFCKDASKVKLVLTEVGLPFLLDLMNSSSEEQVTAVQYCFQTILSTLSGYDAKTDKGVNKKLMEENQKEIDSVMIVLTKSITSRVITGICRDAIIELLLKNIGYKVLDWSAKFIKIEGVHKLMEVASELQEYHYESCIDITSNTRMTTAICLSKVNEAQYDEKARQKFLALIEDCLKEKLAAPDIESKVRAMVAITTLLLGPLDIGNNFIGKEGILQMMLVMAGTDDTLQQKVACEALIAGATKKDKCRTIISQGTDILKKLYQSKDPQIKVRALVGLCKLGSFGGTDATMRPFADGASLKLSEACRRFLINPTKDKEMQRWACEGLSYLTLDAEVKEKLIEDTPAIRSMIELAKSGDMNCLYGVVTTFVNLCNAYDKQEIIPEMIEIAKFAKHHIPEEHELDDKDFIDKRVRILAEEGAASALAVLSKAESPNSRELIGRLFNAICEQQSNRGLVVQQGGTKALIHLATDDNGTPKGRNNAAQALSRIAITINPEVAFPGQRAYEVVRPLLNLLHIDCSGLENFEALMGLCNIAGVSESTRQRIIKEKGLPQIEHYMYEDHELIRRAAIQCMANMCSSPTVVTILEGKNDRLKYLLLCSADEDEEVIKAASGALCMVLSESKRLCEKIFEAKDWEEILKFLLSHGNKEIQYRGTVIVYLLVASSKEIAEKIIDNHCKEALEAISKIDNPELVLPKAKEYAENTLKTAISWNLIRDHEADD